MRSEKRDPNANQNQTKEFLSAEALEMIKEQPTIEAFLLDVLKMGKYPKDNHLAELLKELTDTEHELASAILEFLNSHKTPLSQVLSRISSLKASRQIIYLFLPPLPFFFFLFFSFFFLPLHFSLSRLSNLP